MECLSRLRSSFQETLDELTFREYLLTAQAKSSLSGRNDRKEIPMKKGSLPGLQRFGRRLFLSSFLLIPVLYSVGQTDARRPAPYVPPVASQTRLGSIPLDRATPVPNHLAGAKAVLRLPDGQLYIDADMDIDADGSPRARRIDPCCGQLQTSLSYAGVTGQDRFVNSEEVPYIVLPGGFFAEFGIKLGDVAAVIFKDKVVYALFADTGPRTKAGEGSIKLAQMLGHDPFITRRNGRRVVGRSIPRDVLYIVFPGSRNPDITPRNVVERTREKAKELFAALGGVPE
jgi:hypothetical protein